VEAGAVSMELAPSWQVGAYRVRPISDGDLHTSLDVVLGLDRAVAQSLAGTGDDGRLGIPVTSFLITGPGPEIVLVDAGSGTAMQPTLGRLPDNLRAAGVPPEAITHVVLTHVHPDHANGLVNAEGAANFPNAELVVAAPEAAFWLSDPAGPESSVMPRQRAMAARNLAPYRERMRLARDGEQILGLTAIITPGHTPGHTCWRLDGAGESLLVWGDIVHIAAIQIPRPDAAVTYDQDPDRARQGRARILDMAATERLLIAGAHVTAPGIGHIVRHAGGYAFEA